MCCNACHQVLYVVRHVNCMLVMTLELFSPFLTTFMFAVGIWTGWESPNIRWHSRAYATMVLCRLVRPCVISEARMLLSLSTPSTCILTKRRFCLEEMTTDCVAMQLYVNMFLILLVFCHDPLFHQY